MGSKRMVSWCWLLHESEKKTKHHVNHVEHEPTAGENSLESERSRQDRLKKNREAARASRLRHKEYVRQLEKDVEHLKSENTSLRRELDRLRHNPPSKDDDLTNSPTVFKPDDIPPPPSLIHESPERERGPIRSGSPGMCSSGSSSDSPRVSPRTNLRSRHHIHHNDTSPDPPPLALSDGNSNCSSSSISSINGLSNISLAPSSFEFGEVEFGEERGGLVPDFKPPSALSFSNNFDLVSPLKIEPPLDRSTSLSMNMSDDVKKELEEAFDTSNIPLHSGGPPKMIQDDLMLSMKKSDVFS